MILPLIIATLFWPALAALIIAVWVIVMVIVTAALCFCVAVVLLVSMLGRREA